MLPCGRCCTITKKNEYYQSGNYYTGITGKYFNKVLDTVIEFGNFRNIKGTILDYGCGVGHFKRRLLSYNKDAKVIGYDIVPEISDVKDIGETRPDIIVSNHVFEHIARDDLVKLIQRFRKLNPRAPLVISLPTENSISKIGAILTLQFDAHKGHITSYRTVNQVLGKFYRPVRRKKVFLGMSEVTLYHPK